MKKNTKILILGSSGMLGSSVFDHLHKHYPLTKGASRIPQDKDHIKFIYKSKKDLKKLFINEKFDFVINCIGILKNTSSNYKINYQLPIDLAQFSEIYNFKIINISTDDVYGDLTGVISEESFPRPKNNYAKSKLKGEVSSPRIINIRTSIIGRDPEKKGLIDWVIKNEGKIVSGFVNQQWSGCTTLQFAELCKKFIEENNFEKFSSQTPIVLFFPLGPITKYELIKKISKIFKINLKVEKSYSPLEIKRNFKSLVFDKKFLQSYTTEIDKALTKLND